METGTRRNLFLIALCALSFVLLACRVQSLLQAEATSTPPRTRAALRPTFTPRPAESATPTATETSTETLTPEPSPTESLTPVPPPPEPTDTRAPTQRPTTRPATRPTNTRPRPTNTSFPRPSNTPEPSNTPLPQPTPTPTPTVKTQYTASGKSCTAAANATADTVTGTITENGVAAPNKRVRGSAGPGGEPVSLPDALSDAQGHYTVTFSCGGAACNGDFWVWMVTFDGRAVSPYIKFSFGTSCRRGVVNFSK